MSIYRKSLGNIMQLIKTACFAFLISLICTSVSFGQSNLNIFTRDGEILIWPVTGIRHARNPGEIDRKTKKMTLKYLRSDESQGRLGIGSIVGNYSQIKLYSSLSTVCTLLNAHLNVHNAEYFDLYQKDIWDIPVIDQYATKEGRRFKVTLNAKIDAGILSELFPKLKLSGDIEVEFISKNARDRFIKTEQDRNFLFKKVRFGSVCKNILIPENSRAKLLYIDNYTYGDFSARIKIKAGFFGNSITFENGSTLHGAFLFRPDRNLRIN